MRTFPSIFKIFLAISGILLLVFFRFFQLGQIPYGIALDEANYGYDAFSILNTGKDMWGQIGISLKSLGEYKPTGLTFTIMPFIQLFGLSTLSTRLPSAIYGLLTVVVSYFLLSKLLKDKVVAFIGAMILGLSPWHLGLSRQYYESVSGLFFIATSIYFQIKYIRDPKNVKNIVIAAIFASIAGYYYQVLRYIGLGLLGIAVLISHLPKYDKIIKYGLTALLVWILASSAYLGDMFGSRGLIRLGQENSMHEYGDVLVVTEKRQLCYLSTGKNLLLSKICYAWWNKPGEKLIQIGKTYMELVSPNYLFDVNNQGDTISEGNGAYLEITVIFYLLGLFYLLKNISKKEHQYILLAYLFSILPIAASFSLGIQRNVVGLFLVAIISGYGISYGYELLVKNVGFLVRAVIMVTIVLVFAWLQTRYIANYFLVYTKLKPEVWHSDTPELMTWLSENRNGRKIAFYDFSYGTLYYSFFAKLDPLQFQKDSIWTEPDKYGALNIVGLKGMLSSGSDLYESICKKQSKDEPSTLLVITGSKPEWEKAVLKQTKNYIGIHVLHEVYDSKDLFEMGMCGR